MAVSTAKTHALALQNADTVWFNVLEKLGLVAPELTNWSR